MRLRCEVARSGVGGDDVEVGVEALGLPERGHPVRPWPQQCRVEHGAGLLGDLAHSGGEEDPPAVGRLGDRRITPRLEVEVGIVDLDALSPLPVDGVDAPAGEDDDAGGEVHRRHPVLDEGLEPGVAVADHDHAHGGADGDGGRIEAHEDTFAQRSDGFPHYRGTASARVRGAPPRRRSKADMLGIASAADPPAPTDPAGPDTGCGRARDDEDEQRYPGSDTRGGPEGRRRAAWRSIPSSRSIRAGRAG